MFKTLGTGGAALILLAAGMVPAGEPAKSTQQFQFGPITISADARFVPVADEQLVAEKEAVKPDQYWIGLACVPVHGALRSQLGLPAGQGLVVMSVFPDSPAKKAGVEEHDVLLKAGGKTLGKVRDLIDAVEASPSKPLALDVIRGGKHRTLNVQPAKRPEELAAQEPGEKAEEGDWETLRHWFDNALPGWEGKPPMQIRVFGPSTILPPGAATMPPLPDNMTVTITRHGSQPAKIVVQQGDKRWEVTEKELDKLPADVRTHVTPMLGGSMGAGIFQGMGGPRVLSTEVRNRMERRMDEMNRRIEAIHHSVEELQRGKAPAKSSGTAK